MPPLRTLGISSMIVGTVGNPKGCLITHNGLSEAILALSSFAADVKMADIRKGRYLAAACGLSFTCLNSWVCDEVPTAIAFDVHLAETFVPLALGMTLISAKRGELLENLPLYINLLEITHVVLVPSLIDATMCVVEDDRKQKEMKLRYISSGGEKITDSVRRVLLFYRKGPYFIWLFSLRSLITGVTIRL